MMARAKIGGGHAMVAYALGMWSRIEPDADALVAAWLSTLGLLASLIVIHFAGTDAVLQAFSTFGN